MQTTKHFTLSGVPEAQSILTDLFTHSTIIKQMNYNVNEQTRNVLIRLADGWTPPQMNYGCLTSIHWGEFDLSTVKSNEIFVSDDNAINVKFSEPVTRDNFSTWNVAQEGKLTNKPLAATTDVGLKIVAEYGSMPQISMRSSENGIHYSGTLVGNYWSAVHNDEPPSTWVGQIHGNFTITPGNLVVRGVADQLALEGNYKYYLVRVSAGNDCWHIVIDTEGTGVPARASLYSDLIVMQFCLGLNIKIGLLSGFGDGGEVTANVGGRFGKVHPKGARTAPPVPLEFADATWIAPLFRRISIMYRERPELKLYIPLSLYLDALTDHLDGAYLKLHVALEAFALRLLEQNSAAATTIVKNYKQWSNWVNNNRDQISSHATEGHGNSLVEKVRNSARLASGRVVPNAFAQANLVVTDAMKGELGGRDVVAHTALMSPDDQRDYRRDLERIALVRTMLVALLARAVGYSGPIMGWTRDNLNNYECADSCWWIAGEDDLQLANETNTVE